VAVLLLRVDKRRTWSVAIVSGWDGSTVMENNSAHVTIKDCRTREEKVNMRGLGDSNCRPGSFGGPFWARQVCPLFVNRLWTRCVSGTPSSQHLLDMVSCSREVI